MTPQANAGWNCLSTWPGVGASACKQRFRRPRRVRSVWLLNLISRALTLQAAAEFPSSRQFCRQAGSRSVLSRNTPGLTSSCTRGAVASETCSLNACGSGGGLALSWLKSSPSGCLVGRGPGRLGQGPLSSRSLAPSRRAALHTGFPHREGGEPSEVSAEPGKLGKARVSGLSFCEKGRGATTCLCLAPHCPRSRGSLVMESKGHHLSLPSACLAGRGHMCPGSWACPFLEQAQDLPMASLQQLKQWGWVCHKPRGRP